MKRVVMKASVLALIFLWILSMGCASAPKMSPEEEAKVKEYWRLYLKQSPEWKEAKQEWLGMGEEARKCMINYLLLDIRQFSVQPRIDAVGNPEPGWKRPVRELAALGHGAMPQLLKYLRTMKDETLVPPFIEATAKFAEVKDLTVVLQPGCSSDEINYHCRLVKVLFYMEDPNALDEILRILNEPYEWKIRATAADVLRNYRGPRMDEVKQNLQKATTDEDPSVKAIAEKSLKALNRINSNP